MIPTVWETNNIQVQKMNTYTVENYITITKSIHILNKIYYDLPT